MMKTINITKQTKDIEEVFKLYNDSFPFDERIPWERLYHSLADDRIMQAYYEEDRLIGLTCVFLHENLVYLSYLAIIPALRNHGYGSKVLKHLQDEYPDHPFVIDIEEALPEADNYEERVRRRNFYIHNGYQSTGIFYHFYHVDYELLSHNGLVTKEMFHNLIRKHWGPIAESAIYR